MSTWQRGKGGKRIARLTYLTATAPILICRGIVRDATHAAKANPGPPISKEPGSRRSAYSLGGRTRSGPIILRQPRRRIKRGTNTTPASLGHQDGLAYTSYGTTTSELAAFLLLRASS
jgi:hypothetical protein